MNHFVFSAVLTFLTSGFISAYFVLKKSKNARLFGIYWLSISFWSFTVGFQQLLLKVLPDYLWGWFLHFGCIFIPIIFLHFAVRYTQSNLNKLLFFGYIITVSYVLLNTFTKLFTYTIAYRDLYAYPKPAFLYPVYFLTFVSMIVIGSLLLLLFMKNRDRIKNKTAFVIFLIAHSMAYLGAMDNFLIMADIKIFPLYPFGLYLAVSYAVVSGLTYDCFTPEE